jgi:hypothetical protein
MFHDFATKAFQRRPGVQVPGIKWVVEHTHKGRYRSKGLEASLIKAFGQRAMFGEADKHSGENMRLKVGVTVTSQQSCNPYLVANYNRAEEGSGGFGELTFEF